MKAIMVMFDTLNRRMLPPYGCDWTHAPNFARLAEQFVADEAVMQLGHIHIPGLHAGALVGTRRGAPRRGAAECVRHVR